MKTAILAVVCSLFIGTHLYAESPDKNIVLTKMVEAYGGSEALSKAASYVQSWRVVRAADGIEGTDTRRVTLPDRLYIKLSYPDRGETRILEGEVGIKVFNNHEKRQVSGPMLDAMKVQLMRLYNPLELKEFKDNIRIKSEKGEYILLFAKNGVECDYYVDPKNFHIVKTVGKLKMGPQTMQFVTFYKDFSKTDGVLMPHTEIKYAGNVNTATNYLLSTRFVKIKKVGKHRYEQI